MNKNNKSDLLVITSYPPKKQTHGEGTVGVASYAKNTLTSLQDYSKKTKIVVVAEKLPGEKDTYTDKSIKVERVWKRNSFSSFPNLLKTIWKYRSTKNVLIEFELAMFGEILHLLPFPIFLLILRLLGKKTTLVLHQVIPDINELSGHMNIRTNSYTSMAYNAGIQIFYLLAMHLVSKTIVFEESLSERLSKITHADNITVIPHGIEEFDRVTSKKEARKQLGLPQKKFIVVSFGFIAWYKGTDWLVAAFKKHVLNNKKNDSMLVIAGGANPNHTDKPFYTRYIQGVTKEADTDNILVTGFVPEDKIELYYQAADVIIFPYRTFMSASGPLSLAFSYKKPFLLSQSLKQIVRTQDFKKAMNSEKVKEHHLYYQNEQDFKKKMKLLKTNVKLRKKVTAVSSDIAKSRSWNAISKNYYEEIFQ